MKGKSLFQTNLIVNFTNGESKTYLDIHPDQPMFIEKEMLTLETSNGEMIWYIPAVSIIDYYTECVWVSYLDKIPKGSRAHF